MTVTSPNPLSILQESVHTKVQDRYNPCSHRRITLCCALPLRSPLCHRSRCLPCVGKGPVGVRQVSHPAGSGYRTQASELSPLRSSGAFTRPSSVSDVISTTSGGPTAPKLSSNNLRAQHTTCRMDKYRKSIRRFLNLHPSVIVSSALPTLCFREP